MSLIFPEQKIEIPCQYNHQNPTEYIVFSGKEIVNTFCQECLTNQTLPKDAMSVSKVNQRMKQQKLISFNIANFVFTNYVKLIEKFSIEFDTLKTLLLQELDSSISTINLWKYQLEEYQVNEKKFDQKYQLQSLHLSNEEYQLQEHIRLEQKILDCNQAFHQKVNHLLKEFPNLVQKCQQMLDQFVNESELKDLLIKQNELKSNKAKGFENCPNKRFLQRNFDQIQFDPIKCNFIKHLNNWRSYNNGTEEIEEFYYDMKKNENFLSYLFPNFFKSSNIINSVRLNLQERNEIINDQQVTKQLYENLQMYLRYFGVQLVEKKITINDIKERNQYEIIMQDELRLNTHRNKFDRLGLQRVISSLSVLNQRNIALLLVAFTKEAKFFYEDTFINYDLLQEEGNQDKKALKFASVKNYYLQEDLIDKDWATYKILTNQNLDV